MSSVTSRRRKPCGLDVIGLEACAEMFDEGLTALDCCSSR